MNLLDIREPLGDYRPGSTGDELLRLMVVASGDLWAGAEVMIYHLCCGLRDHRDLEVLPVLLNQGRLAEELRGAGLKVVIADEQVLPGRRLLGKIRHTVREFSPHVIHSHRYKENLLAWLATKGGLGIGLVATQHGMPEGDGTGLGIKSRLRADVFFRLLSKGFDRTVCVSDEMRRALTGSYGFREKNLAVVHNGIDLPAGVGKPVRRNLLIGSAGRLVPVKDYSLFVEIARLAVSECPQLRFVLAGEGPEAGKLRDLVENYGLKERFVFTGHVVDMDSFYSSLDVYINTSVHEGIPMSVLEAMAHRLPVIAPEVGGFLEIVVDGTTGFLIKERAAADFVKRILDLVPDVRREEMGIEARRRAEDCFSGQAMAREYSRIYEEVRKS